MDHIERLIDGGELLSLIIRERFLPHETTFVTQPEQPQQVGFVVYPKGGYIKPHRHRHLQRQIRGTGEVLLVKQGKCEVEIYSSDGRRVANRLLEQGDVLIMISGGHAFRMLEDTVLLEVKQGPYLGNDEKDIF